MVLGVVNLGVAVDSCVDLIGLDDVDRTTSKIYRNMKWKLMN